MISDTDIQASHLAYYGNHHNSRQWRQFILALITEMYESAGSTDACSFLRQVGTRIAAAHPLPEQPTLKALETALNRILRSMDWGWVRLAVADDSIRLVHGAYPGILERAEPWGQAIAATLEGMYQHWFQQQNKDVVLKVQCIKTGQNGALVFRCGS